MNSDLIRRSDAIAALSYAGDITSVEAIAEIKALPSVAPVERHGVWVKDRDRVNHWHCSNCGFTEGRFHTVMLYCYKCGTRLYEEEDSHE